MNGVIAHLGLIRLVGVKQRNAVLHVKGNLCKQIRHRVRTEGFLFAKDEPLV